MVMEFVCFDPCNAEKVFEDIEYIEHIILRCSALTEVRKRLFPFTTDFVLDKPVLKVICDAYLKTDDTRTCMQFFLDCSVMPLVIAAVQEHGEIIHFHLFKITRCWCRSLHQARMRLLGRF